MHGYKSADVWSLHELNKMLVAGLLNVLQGLIFFSLEYFKRSFVDSIILSFGLTTDAVNNVTCSGLSWQSSLSVILKKIKKNKFKDLAYSKEKTLHAIIFM